MRWAVRAPSGAMLMLRQRIAKEGLPGYQAEVREINEQIGETMKDLNREVVRAKRERTAQ